MRPTRRGVTVALAVVLAFGSASFFGARGLNAVAAPGLVALGAAVVQVWRAEAPTISRSLPKRGVQGETVEVEVAFDVPRPYSARFAESLRDGLEGVGTEVAFALGSRPLRYELELRGRGRRVVGPAVVEVRDVLGLVSRRFLVDGQETVLVRPPVHPLWGVWADELVRRFGHGDDRQQFDSLRPYRRGDPLRDVHWRSSAKLPGESFVVKQFSSGEDERGVRLAGESEVGYADALATATASIAVHLLTEGFRVGVETADLEVPPHGGPDQRDRVLDALAQTRGGALKAGVRERADVVVRADASGVTVSLAEATVPFREIVGRRVDLAPAGVAAEPAEGVA